MGRWTGSFKGGGKRGKNPQQPKFNQRARRSWHGRNSGGRATVCKILAPEDPDYPHRSEDSIPLDLMGEEVFEAEMELGFQGERR